MSITFLIEIKQDIIYALYLFCMSIIDLVCYFDLERSKCMYINTIIAKLIFVEKNHRSGIVFYRTNTRDHWRRRKT